MNKKPKKQTIDKEKVRELINILNHWAVDDMIMATKNYRLLRRNAVFYEFGWRCAVNEIAGKLEELL